MAWKFEFGDKAKAQLRRLDADTARRILAFFHNRLPGMHDPREIGESLKGVLKGYWRYRVGDYRIVCHIDDNIMTVLAVHVAHRSEVYKHPHLP